jgi:thiol-disulfide isomerase/thioredoxin
MTKLKSGFEIASKILILSAFVIVVAVIVEQKYFSSATRGGGPSVGAKISIPSEYFHPGQRSVILVLQTTCPYCHASMPFYKGLLDRSRGKDINYVAFFPQAKELAAEQLDKYGIKGVTVDQTDIWSFRISGTPALLITNDEGVIEHSWVGKLTPDQELEVVKALNL